MNYILTLMDRSYRLTVPDKLRVCQELQPFISEEFSGATPVDGDITLKAADLIEGPIPDEQVYFSASKLEERVHQGNFCKVFIRNHKTGIYTSESILEEKKITVISRTGYLSNMLNSDVLLKRLYLESFFLLNQSFILHSSLIRIHDCTIAFCAPKQTGKSTQASLWAQKRGAQILNGDRAGIRIMQEATESTKTQIRAYGLPYAGSSEIYRNEGAPLKAVILLEQAKENTLERVSPKAAFARMFCQVNVPRTDELLLNKAISHLETVVRSIPVYLLKCTPDERAVRLVEQELFEKEDTISHD